MSRRCVVSHPLLAHSDAADSVPLQLIQTLLLNLLQDVSEDTIGDTGLPEVSHGLYLAEYPQLSDMLRLSTSTAVQCTAYRILNQIIRRRTIALVLEVEASISDVEDGQVTQVIALPDELIANVVQSAPFDRVATVRSPSPVYAEPL